MLEKIITKSFERLLDKGKNRGFITYDELGKSLGKRGGSNENVEKAFLIIADNKVTLVNKKSEYQSNKKKDEQHCEDPFNTPRCTCLCLLRPTPQGTPRVPPTCILKTYRRSHCPLVLCVVCFFQAVISRSPDYHRRDLKNEPENQ